MPIYEFYSPDTHKIYNFLSRRILASDVTPRCPDGDSHKMQREISRFAFIGKAKDPAEGGGEGTMDPAQEAAMMELAGEMERLGDAQPDPRTLGAMLRRLVGVTGKKPPPEMEAMLRRLEKGEDPEALEAEMAALGDTPDSWLEDGEPGSLAALVKNKMRGAPRRDPTLYEMAEYL